MRAMYKRVCCYQIFGYILHTSHTETLTHWGRDNIDAVPQTTLSNAFSSMKIVVF